MKSYQDKICIVTGATSGIGKALTEELIRRGARVILASRDSALLSEQTKLLGPHAEGQVCDVTDLKHVQKVVDFAVRTYGRIDYMFNNAGIAVIGEVRDITSDDWNKVLDVNMKGVVHGVISSYPVMIKQGFGHIVNTSSVAGLTPATMEVPYVASKYAVVGLSHALRMEGKRLGVRVSVVCPGPINTPLWKNSKVVGSAAQNPLTFLSLGWSPPLVDPHKAAQIILKGVANNKATILTDFLSRLGWYIYRLSPSLWMWAYEAYTMKKFRKMRIGS